MEVENDGMQHGRGTARFPFAGGTVDADRCTYTDATGRRAMLSCREMGMLRLFASSPEIVFSRDELSSRFWGCSYSHLSRSVDQQIYRLRRKVGREARRIRSVSGMGYRFVGDCECSGIEPQKARCA